MRSVERQTICKLVVQFYTQIADFDKKRTVDHFRALGEKSDTVYKIIRRFERTGSYEFKQIPKRLRPVATPQMVRKVTKFLVNTNHSVRQTALKLKIPKSTVQDIKKREGIQTHKCKTVPKMSEYQQKMAKINSRKILSQSANKVLILDDETYISVDPLDTKVSKNFNFKDISSVPKEVQFKGRTKFPKHYLVWQLLDEYGNVSDPFIKVGTLTAEEYLKECLIKRLLPFIEKYHRNSNIVFWADMATIHYANIVLNWFRENDISFIEKKVNLANCPQARPIEKFWSLCKLEYSKTSKPSKSLVGFKILWKNLSLRVAKKYGHSLMSTVRKRLREIRDGGAFAPFTN